MAKLVCNTATVTFDSTTFTGQASVETRGTSQVITGKAMEDAHPEKFVNGGDFTITLTGYADSTLANEYIGLVGTTDTLTVLDQNGGTLYEGSCLCTEATDEQAVDDLEKGSITWVSAAAPTTPTIA